MNKKFEENTEKFKQIHEKIENVNETMSQRMDKNNGERKQEIADMNERLGKANETITQNRVALNARIDRVKEDNRVLMEDIQKEQENLGKLQKQSGERCDSINATVTNLTGQVRQNQEEIEMMRARPNNIAHISMNENREGINF